MTTTPSTTTTEAAPIARTAPPRPACINMVEQIFAREPWTVTHWPECGHQS
jgi:hypothetical protein